MPPKSATAHVYRALLKACREADASPALKQELVRRPLPALQVIIILPKVVLHDRKPRTSAVLQGARRATRLHRTLAHEGRLFAPSLSLGLHSNNAARASFLVVKGGDGGPRSGGHEPQGRV